ncbi:hypothetical protein [Bradyrhizobium arachidis]|uniref:Uncharacterized protein n=1 Tax=Bradyrhizobium arachidis TaxID=858423 RepID=A0AAE7TIR6_9BRAD|nr:hypothetical protein [Bradyrhizobium arachidis]QOZ69191.1 hypothetical protein WN72_24850 [Bradyrhizobium arachidis]SFV11280.1 hypothetical protein SAMN05192541_1174 [Bradyrhizobium arachidis]
MNRQQLRAEREAAGAAYVEAVKAFREAWARLAAIDRTLANSNVAGNDSPPRSFHFMRNNLEQALRSFQHSEFAPRILVNEWHDRAVQISDKQIEGFRP